MKRLITALSIISTLSFALCWAVEPPQTNGTTAPVELTESEIAAQLPEFTLPDGQWITDGSVWAFSQVGPVDKADMAIDITALTPPTTLVDLDRSNMTLVQAMMRRVRSEGPFQVWESTGPDLSGTAVTTTVCNQEIPLEIQVAWPADDGLWSVFCAKRKGGSPQPMMDVPESSLVASRVLQTGATYSQLFRCSLSNPKLQASLVKAGWNLDHTSSPATDDKSIFRIHRADQCYEISYLACTTAGDANSVLVRLVQPAEELSQ